MNIRNAKHNGQGGIDCELEHPVYGWIPFTAHPDDSEEHGRAIFAALAGGRVAAYVGPTAEEMTQRSMAAARAALAATDAALARGVEDLITALKVKGVISDADLPLALNDRIAARQAAREKLNA